MADGPHMTMRQELQSSLDKINFRDLLSIAGYTYSEDSGENHRSPCFRLGGRKDRSEEKMLLMNKGTSKEFLYDLRENKAYDKLSFMFKYSNEFFTRFSPHAWGNDFTRMKDVVRNMAGNFSDSDIIKKSRTNLQNDAVRVAQPFVPARWFTKPLMEVNSAMSQQRYLMRERGLSKETLKAMGPNLLAISDLLKYKAPNGRRTKEISDMLDKVAELTPNKREMIMSFIRSMDNIDTHFNMSYFEQNVAEPMKKEGLTEEAIKPLRDYAASCSVFEMNRVEDTVDMKNNKVAEFKTLVEAALKANGIDDAENKAIAFSYCFNSCFFERQLETYLVNMESCLPESYIENTQKFINEQLAALKELPNTSVSDMDFSTAMNFVQNISYYNIRDSKSYEAAFRKAFKCLTPVGIYNFSPEYAPISKIRGQIVQALAMLRQHPVLFAANEVRRKVKNPMYKQINIAFPVRDLVSKEVKGYEVKCINRAVKINVPGSNLFDYFVTLGQQDVSKVKHCYLFESSIDAMSFLELEAQKGHPIDLSNTVLISCCGVPKSKHMSIIKEHYPTASIHLCLDRDFAGKKASILANCQFQGLQARITIAGRHEEVVKLAASDKWDEKKYPAKDRYTDSTTGDLMFKSQVADAYEINVQGEINGKEFNKSITLSAGEFGVRAFHEQFPEVKKVVQYHIPIINYVTQIGKLELGGTEFVKEIKDWNEMLTVPKEAEKLNREFMKNLLAQKNQAALQKNNPQVGTNEESNRTQLKR